MREEERDCGASHVHRAGTEQKAKETKSELFNLRFALRTGHLTDFSKVRAMRQSYAQIQTVISEKR